MGKIDVSRIIGMADLVRGPGYVSNTHWIVRARSATGAARKPDRRSRIRADRLTRPSRPRRPVRRTNQVRGVHGTDAVLFTRRGLRVWVRAAYANALLGTVAYASTSSEVVTDKATRWTVAVMPMRIE